MATVRPFARLAAATLAAFAVVTAAAPASAQTIPNGPAASADAYGLLVDVGLLPTHTPVRHGPVSRATQDSPPNVSGPAATAQVLEAGPVPADSSLVDHVGVMESMAGTNALPNAVASAQVANVSLLGEGENAKITATLVRAHSNSNC